MSPVNNINIITIQDDTKDSRGPDQVIVSSLGRISLLEAQLSRAIRTEAVSAEKNPWLGLIRGCGRDTSSLGGGPHIENLHQSTWSPYQDYRKAIARQSVAEGSNQ